MRTGRHKLPYIGLSAWSASHQPVGNTYQKAYNETLRSTSHILIFCHFPRHRTIRSQWLHPWLHHYPRFTPFLDKFLVRATSPTFTIIFYVLFATRHLESLPLCFANLWYPVLIMIIFVSSHKVVIPGPLGVRYFHTTDRLHNHHQVTGHRN
jgi:hypothetical protein